MKSYKELILSLSFTCDRTFYGLILSFYRTIAKLCYSKNPSLDHKSHKPQFKTLTQDEFKYSIALTIFDEAQQILNRG